MKNSSAINYKLCQGKDVFERMNFLYQASVLAAPTNPALASYYNSIMYGCAKKSVLRIEHNLKRAVCKSCHCPLISGETARVRLRKKVMKTTCLVCKKTKKLPTEKDNKLWWDQPQALLETYNYYLKKQSSSTYLDKCVSNNVNEGESISKVSTTGNMRKENIANNTNGHSSESMEIVENDNR